MRNNASYRITGIRGVRIKMFDEIVKTLDTIRHVSNFKKYFISLCTLYCKEYKVESKWLLKVALCCDEGTKNVPDILLQGFIKSFDINQQNVCTQVDFAFVSVPLEFGLGSKFKNMSQSSSKMMDNAALPPPPIVPLYSIARYRPRRDLKPS